VICPAYTALWPIAQALGADAVLGTELVCFAGRCTGVLHGHPNMRSGKLERVRRWLQGRQQGEATLRRSRAHASPAARAHDAHR